MNLNERRKAVNKYNLITLAEELGYKTKKIGRGNYYTLEEHDSVRIKIENNTFIRYSNGAFGDPVAFLMEFAVSRSNRFKSLSYCIMWLEKKLNIDKIVIPEKAVKKEVKNLILPEKDDNYRRVFAYLLKTRCIDKQIITAFMKRKMLYQDKKHKNVVFIGYDNNKPVYAMCRSTLPSNSFKIECEGCNYDYGISFDNDNSDTLFITESVIDMMSLMSLNIANNIHEKHSFLSINSIYKDQCIYKYLNDHPNIKDVIISLDNDEYGIKEAKKIKEKIKEHNKNISSMLCFPTEKDWNEDLVKKQDINIDIKI